MPSTGLYGSKSDSTASYARPETLPVWKSVHPRPFQHAFSVITEPPILPSLPSPARHRNAIEGYILTSHIIPASYARISPDIPVPILPPYSLSTSKQERRDKLSKLADEMIRNLDKTAAGDISSGSRRILWNCVNRYVKRDLGPSRPGQHHLTLFFTHAVGCPKELWEATLRSLLAATPQVAEVWTWEAINHGDSAIINAGNLSGVFDWSDDTRDILNFLVQYLPSEAHPDELPTHLPRVSEHESESRRTGGYYSRTLVGVGQSFGGATISLAALQYPRLFSSLILIDPGIIQPFSYTDHKNWVVSALQRLDHWESRDAAYNHLKKSPVMSTWNPDVLELYIEHALKPGLKGGFRLKGSAIQEALLYSDVRTQYEAWELFDQLDERVALHWIVPGIAHKSGMQSEEAVRVRVWRRPKNSSNVRIPSAGHLIAQEAPGKLARSISLFLDKQYGVRGPRL